MSEHSSSLETAWMVYADATQTIRHYDGERSATHRVALTVLSVLFAFSGSSLYTEKMSLAVCGIGAVMTLVLAAISIKFGTLIDRERARARAAREIMAERGDATIKSIDAQRSIAMKQQFMARWRLSTMWLIYYIVIFFGFLALFGSRYVG